MELAVVWLVVWFIAIWALPYASIVLGVVLGALLDNDWTIVVVILFWILALVGFGFAVFQFIMQIISVVSLVT